MCTAPNNSMQSDYNWYLQVSFIKYVMLFGSFFMFSTFPPIRFTRRNSCYFSKSMMKTYAKVRIENRTSLEVVMVIGSVCLLKFVTGYLGPLNYVHW
jgi:hypothetical protein